MEIKKKFDGIGRNTLKDCKVITYGLSTAGIRGRMFSYRFLTAKTLLDYSVLTPLAMFDQMTLKFLFFTRTLLAVNLKYIETNSMLE